MSRRFVTLDVFTTRPHAGNPLAVVLDSDGLDTAAMQAIAREFNLSETVFVAPPANPAHRAAVRIFTPGQELPFAGHPTVGTAVLLALRDAAEGRAADRLVLEEKVGLVPCVVALGNARSARATFTLPKLPEQVAQPIADAALAEALGLEVAARGIRLRGELLHEPDAGSLAPRLLSHVAEGLERDGVRGFGKALYGDGWNTSFTRATEATVRREFAMFGAFEPAPLSVAPQSISITVGSASPPSRFASTQALAAFLGARWSVLDGTGHAAHLDNALTPAAIERLTGSASEPLSHQPSQ